jgi:hypothetical protein
MFFLGARSAPKKNSGFSKNAASDGSRPVTHHHWMRKWETARNWFAVISAW